MNKRIKKLAEQAGITFDSLGASYTSGSLLDVLERFAELIFQDEAKSCAEHYLEIMSIAIDSARKGEREACAALCDAECNKEDPMKIIGTYESGCYMMAEFLANEIRSRK